MSYCMANKVFLIRSWLSKSWINQNINPLNLIIENNYRKNTSKQQLHKSENKTIKHSASYFISYTHAHLSISSFLHLQKLPTYNGMIQLVESKLGFEAVVMKKLMVKSHGSSELGVVEGIKQDFLYTSDLIFVTETLSATRTELRSFFSLDGASRRGGNWT